MSIRNFFTMTDADYEASEPHEYDSQFDSDVTYGEALESIISELLVDDDDSTHKTYIVDDLGNIHAQIWMKHGNVWVHPTDDLPYSPISYDDTF